MSETYSVDYDCTNCGYAGPVIIKFGVIALDVDFCPTCGIKTAKKRPFHKPCLTPLIPPGQPWPPTHIIDEPLIVPTNPNRYTGDPIPPDDNIITCSAEESDVGNFQAY